jgi:Putative MetA-pathway of phenol degradation
MYAHSRSRLGVRLLTAYVVWSAAVTPASAQSSITDVLTFLLTNRSIPTGDFERDEQAAIEARDILARFLTLEQATLPVTSSSGGFTYRLEPTLGTVVRSSDSFGPFFAERSLTAGKNQASLGVGYRSTTFDAIDGRSLRDGTLVSTASVLRGESVPFDIETVTLRIRTDTVTLTGNYGVGDRFDVGGAVPLVRVRLEGQRIDTYRGREIVQATGAASASGIGDVVVRAKYNLLRDGASGLSVTGEVRLPTGDEDDLLGAGRASVTPRVIGSYERARLGLHGELGYSFRDVSSTLGYAAAMTVVAVPRLTIIGELSGLRFGDLGRLTDAIEPHPRLVGVDTIRLSGVDQTTHRVLAIAGVKWNVADTWLVSANVRRPLTTAGLDAGWVPTITLDYAFGR